MLNLGLKEVGIKTGSRGEIIVNKHNQTNIKSIFAIGDVTDKITLTPVAIAEGHSFADREFGGLKGLFLMKTFLVLSLANRLLLL